jgi:hypothetical protein
MGLFDKLFQGKQMDLNLFSKKMIVLAVSCNEGKEVDKFLSEISSVPTLLE